MPGSTSLYVLSRLLLGPDAGDVWPWGGKPGVDGGADRGDGRGENVSGWSASQSRHRNCTATAGGSVAGSSCLATE